MESLLIKNLQKHKDVLELNEDEMEEESKISSKHWVYPGDDYEAALDKAIWFDR